MYRKTFDYVGMPTTRIQTNYLDPEGNPGIYIAIFRNMYSGWILVYLIKTFIYVLYRNSVRAPGDPGHESFNQTFY